MSYDMRVEVLLKTDSGYPKDAEVTLFTLANPEHNLGVTHIRRKDMRYDMSYSQKDVSYDMS